MQGLEVYGADGSLTFTTSDRLGRVVSIQDWVSSTIPANTWTQVVDPAYAGHLWGCFVPLYTIDAVADYAARSSNVLTDPVNHPGCIYVAATKNSSYPATLIYGVY